MENQRVEVVVEEGMSTRTKLLIGGGAALAFWWFFFRGGKGPGTGKHDSAPLRFRLLTTGRLLLVDTGLAFTVEEAIARVKQGGRSDVVLTFPGDVTQRDVDSTLTMFAAAGLQVIR